VTVVEHAVLARLHTAAARPVEKVRSQRAFRLVVFALSVAIMGNNAPSPIYPIFQQRFALTTGELTLVFAIVVVGVVPSLLLLGPLSDRRGRRPLLAVALAMGLLGALGFAVAQSLGSLLVARVLQGISFGALSGTAVAALVELEPNGDHARATLVATVTIVASQAIAPLGAGLLAQYAPDPARLAFLVLAGLLVAALLGLAAVPETVRPAPPGERRARAPMIGVPSEIRTAFLVSGAAVVASFGALGLVAALGPKFASSLLRVDNRAVGGAVVFAMLGASAVAQLTARAWPVRRQLIAGAVSLALGLVVVLVGVSGRSLAPFVIGIALAGVGQGLAYLGAQAHLDAVMPAGRRGSVMSAFFLVLYIAASVSALAVGLASGPLGLQTATIIVTSVLAGLALCSGLLSAREATS
jgi:predicted MFS family arabinose efflux permease